MILSNLSNHVRVHVDAIAHGWKVVYDDRQGRDRSNLRVELLYYYWLEARRG